MKKKRLEKKIEFIFYFNMNIYKCFMFCAFNISPDCFRSIEKWIIDYEGSIFSEKVNRWLKIVNQYPKYQTYLTSFLFETSVINKCYCNRMFSYFI